MNVDKIGPKSVDAYVNKTQPANDKVTPPPTKEAAKSEKDEVSISKAARELQAAQKAVEDAPDVREDKVAAIKKQIQDGTYNVPAESVIEKLLSGLKGG